MEMDEKLEVYEVLLYWLTGILRCLLILKIYNAIFLEMTILLGSLSWNKLNWNIRTEQYLTIFKKIFSYVKIIVYVNILLCMFINELKFGS